KLVSSLDENTANWYFNTIADPTTLKVLFEDSKINKKVSLLEIESKEEIEEIYKNFRVKEEEKRSKELKSILLGIKKDNN
ncbi:MAG: hypothetical protein QXD23_02920, partial [Candidatus Micrarchaeaceae archaeon]